MEEQKLQPKEVSETKEVTKTTNLCEDLTPHKHDEESYQKLKNEAPKRRAVIGMVSHGLFGKR